MFLTVLSGSFASFVISFVAAHSAGTEFKTVRTRLSPSLSRAFQNSTFFSLTPAPSHTLPT